jgi:hypothetical protein
MGERAIDLSLDRINVNGNYEPGNCRWATDEVQRSNTDTGKPGRHPRAGAPTRPLRIRATDAEKARWKASAKHAGTDLSAFARQALDELAEAGKERRRGWMRDETKRRSKT